MLAKTPCSHFISFAIYMVVILCFNALLINLDYIMTETEVAMHGVQDLIDTYTKVPEGRKKKVDVLHDDFAKLPKDTRALIEGVMREVYRGDFEIVRKAFVEKLEFFLRLIAHALEEAKCVDYELQAKISDAREKIATVVNEVEVSDEDMNWLRKIGFLPVDVFELTAKLDIAGAIAELRNNIDEYMLILGDKKYIVKILKMYEGLQKLKRLRSFYRNYDSNIVGFNGYHFAQIVVNAGWEEKLKYFENPDNLKRLQEAGFNGSHLAQIVVNAGWEEKLKVVVSESCLALLKRSTVTHNSLAKLLKKKDWRTQLLNLGVSL